MDCVKTLTNIICRKFGQHQKKYHKAFLMTFYLVNNIKKLVPKLAKLAIFIGIMFKSILLSFCKVFANSSMKVK